MSSFPSLTVYTQPGCSPCVALKAALRRHALPFREVDVEANSAALDELRDLGIARTPVLRISGAPGDLDGVHEFPSPSLVRRLSREVRP